LAWRQRDHGRARALIEESLGFKRALGDQLGVARRLRSLALVVMSEGDADAATRLWEQSLTIFRLAGGDAHIGRALSVNAGVGSTAATAYGSLYLSYAAGMAGDVTAQRARLTGAVAVLADMGGAVEEPDWVWAGASLAAAGSRMTVDQLMAEAVAGSEERGHDSLTLREREVVRLVAQGPTNAEIAEALFISKRTVESHVDHIRQKLGHTSRNQLMAWALRESLDSQIP
jgi:DNA-binding CsgD family transcriptional regulator